MAIFNKYKDNLDDPIDSSDTKSQDQPKSLNWLRPIDNGICNAPGSRDALSNLLEEGYWDEDISVMAFEQVPKTPDF